MALSEVRRQGTRLVRRTDLVDQLSDAALDALLAGAPVEGAVPRELDVGDVVVFRDYYRVEAV